MQGVFVTTAEEQLSRALAHILWQAGDNFREGNQYQHHHWRFTLLQPWLSSRSSDCILQNEPFPKYIGL